MNRDADILGFIAGTLTFLYENGLGIAEIACEYPGSMFDTVRDIINDPRMPKFYSTYLKKHFGLIDAKRIPFSKCDYMAGFCRGYWEAMERGVRNLLRWLYSDEPQEDFIM